MIDSGSNIEERYCPSCDRSYVIPLKHCPNDGTKLVTLASDPLLGRILEERFRIDDKLGAGGMGTVYSGNQTSIGRKIAIKVIHSRLSQRTEVVKRFLREAKLASRLNQPNTVTVLDFGQSEDGLLYLIMELLEGRTLGQLMRDEAPFTVSRAAGIAMQLCDALEAAHNLSIIHRDLKPSNVVVLDKPVGRDYLKVLDFGLAKSLTEESATTITHSDAILGTPAYISPEAVLGRDTDARSDLYALGVILYQMVSGRLPFDATTANLMLTSHVNETPRPLPATLDADARELIDRLLAKNPDDRPTTATEVRATLEPLRTSRSPALPATTDGDEIAIADTVGRSSEGLVETAKERPAGNRQSRKSRAPVFIAGALVAAAVTVSLVVVAARAGGEGAAQPPTDAQVTPTATAGPDATVLPAADAGSRATLDAATPPIIDAATRRTTRRRPRDRDKPPENTTDATESKAPPPVWLKSRGGDGGVP